MLKLQGRSQLWLRLHRFNICTKRSGDTAKEGSGCDQLIESTVSDATVRSWLWSTATRSTHWAASVDYCKLLIIDPTLCGRRFSTGRLLFVENLFYFYIILLRYQGIFSYTVEELGTSSKPHFLNSLKHWHCELVKALTAAGVDEKFCTKLMCQHSQSTEIGQLLAEVLAQYIKIRTPERLEFDIPPSVACPTAQLQLFLGKVRQYHSGGLGLKLHHSYINHIPCDDVIQTLDGAR